MLCSAANISCNSDSRGNERSEPVSITEHASYVFNTYGAKFNSKVATCNFNGIATKITKDPLRSHFSLVKNLIQVSKLIMILLINRVVVILKN